MAVWTAVWMAMGAGGSMRELMVGEAERPIMKVAGWWWCIYMYKVFSIVEYISPLRPVADGPWL